MNAEQFDRVHLWHPYSSMVQPQICFKVKKAHGVVIELEDGTSLIDGISSWWCAIHGYNHPKLNEAAVNQLNNMAHVMFAGFTHQPVIDLSAELLKLLAPKLNKFFYADSGSVAVEIALKMAIQYQVNRGNSFKSNFATVKSGYHGDTWNAMSVSYPQKGIHEFFHGFLPPRYFTDKPKSSFQGAWQKEDEIVLQNFFEKNHKHLAGFILEPIVQCAGGMYFYHPNYLKYLRKLCDEYQVLLIFDEIATGFARTGKMFAYEHADVIPDLICLGKALTGGYMTLSVVVIAEEIANIISSKPQPSFMHGPTFMANPLACAIALESTQLLMSQNWKDIILNMTHILNQELSKTQTSKYVKDFRLIGAVGVVELTRQINLNKLMKKIIQKGIWIRPFGHLIYVMPPYVISQEELTFLCQKITELVHELTEGDFY